MLLDATALDGLVSALTGAISTNSMLANLTTLVPFIAPVVIFAFTWRIVKKAVKGASQGKAKIG